MTEEDREWLRDGIRRARMARGLGGLTWEHMGYYYLIGWLGVETNPPQPTTYHDGGGIF